MRHPLILVTFALFAIPAFCDQRINVNIPAGGAQDMLNMTQVSPDISSGATQHPGELRSCVTPLGRKVRETEEGYKECLAAAQKKAKPDPRLTTKP